MCQDARNVLSEAYFLIFLSFFPPSAQIIHKIKKQNNPNITANTEDICDRIFELVDKNKDSKFQVNDLRVTLFLGFIRTSTCVCCWVATTSGHSNYDRVCAQAGGRGG